MRNYTNIKPIGYWDILNSIYSLKANALHCNEKCLKLQNKLAYKIKFTPKEFATPNQNLNLKPITYPSRYT